jgi:histidinol-phosphate phosphatase family protein
MPFEKFHIDSTWTLFLDRDGVVNQLLPNDYVKGLHEFEFNPGALEAIRLLSQKFGHIFIVTNQQGIGKGLMTEKDLDVIHRHMLENIESSGGKIDAVYFAPGLRTPDNLLRKPNTGMALKAKTDFPHIDFNKSIMVGDSEGDMEFADNAGMKKVFICTENKRKDCPVFSSLLEFARWIE